MKKLMLFVAVVGVVSLASCKKKTCTYGADLGNANCCTNCSKVLADACKTYGATCK